MPESVGPETPATHSDKPGPKDESRAQEARPDPPTRCRLRSRLCRLLPEDAWNRDRWSTSISRSSWSDDVGARSSWAGGVAGQGAHPPSPRPADADELTRVDRSAANADAEEGSGSPVPPGCVPCCRGHWSRSRSGAARPAVMLNRSRPWRWRRGEAQELAVPADRQNCKGPVELRVEDPPAGGTRARPGPRRTST